MEENLLPPIFCDFPVHLVLCRFCDRPVGNFQRGISQHDSECYSHNSDLYCWFGLFLELPHMVAGDGFSFEFSEKTSSQCCLQASQIEERGVHEGEHFSIGLKGMKQTPKHGA